MKKIFCLFLVLTITVLSGCSANKTDESTSLKSENDYFSVTYNGDFTYSYEIRDKSGNILLSDNSEKHEPHIDMLDENTVRLMIQRGTGISAQNTVYIDIETGIISENFISVFDENNGRIAYHSYQNSKHYMIVRDIFDKGAFFKEFEIKDDIHVFEDAVVSADFSQDGKKITVTYLAGENYKETTTEFIIE